MLRGLTRPPPVLGPRGPLLGQPVRFWKTPKPKGAKKRAEKKDLGWDWLIAPLEEAPLQLPTLASLKVTHGRKGVGQSGARQFGAALLPPLRWQNPDAHIIARWDGDPSSSDVVPKVSLVLTDGETKELAVKGLRSEAILGEVMMALGADESAVASSMAWAKEYVSRRPVGASAPHHLKRPADAPEDSGAGLVAEEILDAETAGGSESAEAMR